MGNFGTKRAENVTQQPTPDASTQKLWTYENACSVPTEQNNDIILFPTKYKNLSEDDKAALATLLKQISPVTSSIQLTTGQNICVFNNEVAEMATLTQRDSDGNEVHYQLTSMRNYENDPNGPGLFEWRFITGWITTVGPNNQVRYTYLALGDPDIINGTIRMSYGSDYRQVAVTQSFGITSTPQRFGTVNRTQTLETQ